VSRRRLVAPHRATAEGTEVLSPAVGSWLDGPPDGTAVGPGSRIGSVRRLGRRFDLVLEDGPVGRVAGGRSARVVPVAYGDVLFRIVAIAGAAAAVSVAGERAGRSGSPAGDTHAMAAPSDGVFYRRPSPDAAPFVEVGSTVSSGEAIGLVEVMKTFNQILYGGPGLPERATVVAIERDDGAEVRAGDTLIVVRPA
jgi:acetyl-CoA carboxylase biotin carboxyl carrier protein